MRDVERFIEAIFDEIPGSTRAVKQTRSRPRLKTAARPKPSKVRFGFILYLPLVPIVKELPEGWTPGREVFRFGLVVRVGVSSEGQPCQF